MYVIVLQQQSSLLGLYGPVLLHLLGNTGKYSPSCQTNTENKLFKSGYTVKYSLRPQEIPWAPPSGSPSCSGYIYFTVYPSSRPNTDTIQAFMFPVSSSLYFIDSCPLQQPSQAITDVQQHFPEEKPCKSRCKCTKVGGKHHEPICNRPRVVL